VTVGAGVVVGIKQQNPTEHPPEKGLQVILAGFGFMTIGLGHTKLAQVIGVVVGHGVVVGGAIVVHGDSGAGGGGAGAGGPSVVHGDFSPITWLVRAPRIITFRIKVDPAMSSRFVAEKWCAGQLA
jgi:hypothetical protein